MNKPAGTSKSKLMKLNPYPEYKDSGVMWLGKVPTHWAVIPNRGAFIEVNDQNHPHEEMLSVTISRGVIKQSTLLDDSSTKDGSRIDRSSYKLVKPGDIAYNKMRAWQGAIGVSTYRGIISPAYVVERPREGNGPDFLHYLLRTPAFAREAERNSYGIASDMWSLRPEHFKTIRSCLPPPEEQACIVRFLDHADEQIQHYIAGKERLIALLEEQRQALVHQAVTQGLDPNVRLRPSGVEWLGDVPEHWEMRRLGQCTSVSGGATPSMEVNRFWGGSVPWVTPKDMKKDVISDSSMKVTDAAIHETSLQLVEPPVVLMVVRGMILARRVPIAYTTTPVTINQDMKALRTLRGTDAIFLAYSLNSVQEAFKPLIDEAGHGTRRLPTERWRELPITMPPPSEQRAIIEYLDNTKAEINAAIDRSRRQIDLMNEYRTRLIADVVTGQLDVREADKKFSEDNNLALSPWDDIQGLESISAEGGGQRHLREKEKTDGSGNS